MLYTIALVLVALWLAGFVLDVVGGIIHVLLVIAIAIVIFRMLKRAT